MPKEEEERPKGCDLPVHLVQQKERHLQILTRIYQVLGVMTHRPSKLQRTVSERNEDLIQEHMAGVNMISGQILEPTLIWNPCRLQAFL